MLVATLHTLKCSGKLCTFSTLRVSNYCMCIYICDYAALSVDGRSTSVCCCACMWCRQFANKWFEFCKLIHVHPPPAVFTGGTCTGS